MARGWFEKKRAKKEYDLLYHEERVVLEATEEIVHLMEKAGKTKADLAKTLGKSKAYITQALSGGRNMTLRTFASFAWACGYSLRGFELHPIVPPKERDMREEVSRHRWITQVAKEVDQLSIGTVTEASEQELALAA
jgi:transcriptional regulator with XRE-family HTH domain